jgi:hypothetical protein
VRLAGLVGDDVAVFGVMEVVEHVADMAGFVHRRASTVRPGGRMLAATLNRALESFALAIVGAERGPPQGGPLVLERGRAGQRQRPASGRMPQGASRPVRP